MKKLILATLAVVVVVGGVYYWKNNNINSPIVLQQPNGGETLKIGSQEGILWTGGDKNTSVSIKLMSDSANLRCKSSGGKICPQDISFAIPIADGVPNTGTYVWTISSTISTGSSDNANGTDQYQKYWLQICQDNKCDLSNDVITIRK